tara:strand:- start:4071 stop:4631 length:561 start_codon:yes stop_codon:yes gene_type:complete
MAYGKDMGDEVNELLDNQNIAVEKYGANPGTADLTAKTVYGSLTDPLLTQDKLRIGDENYYRQEALGRVYDILSPDKSIGDITDVIKSIATAKWETDYYHLRNKLSSEGMDVETARATADQEIPYPLMDNPDGGDLIINPESMYYPQGFDRGTNVVPGMSEPTDPGYNTIEEEVMGNMINTDKDLF